MTPDPTLVYQPLIPKLADEPLTGAETGALEAPDRRDGKIYRYEPQLQLAVELALATGRPLLLRGDPGSGKSSLAAYVARNLGYRYYEAVVTSQTSAQDLLWRFDLVRRLADAQARDATMPAVPLNDHEYVEPGPLWWVLHRESARRRGWDPSRGVARPADATEPNAAVNAGRDDECAVLLIDELDKADPDVPNALLVPLGSMQFDVADLRGRAVTIKMPDLAPKLATNGKAMSRVLVVITTNEERELPPAFLRRCIVHRLEHPKTERLLEIARGHFHRPPHYLYTSDDEARARAIATQLDTLRTQRAEARRRLPGTAEFLDALRSCITLGVAVDGATWEVVQRSTLLKDEGVRL